MNRAIIASLSANWFQPRTFMLLAAALFLGACGVTDDAAHRQLMVDPRSLPPPVMNYTSVHGLIDSPSNGYDYAYAPTIIRDANGFHAFFCSTPEGSPGTLDSIRYSTSSDGRMWSPPVVKVRANVNTINLSACDPSVVRYDAGDGAGLMYYLFFTGFVPARNNPNNQSESAVFVTRAATLDGTFAQYTQRGTWEVDPNDPKPISQPTPQLPSAGVSYTQLCYGIGEETVVAKDGQLWIWFLDDTLQTPPGQACTVDSKSYAIRLVRTTNPTDWSSAVTTSLVGNVVESIKANGDLDVKWDAALGAFVMFQIINPNASSSRLVYRTSVDGINWNNPATTICDQTCFPNFAHNLGVSGDEHGFAVQGRYLIMFGAPTLGEFQDVDQWGHWGLYGGVVNPFGSVWNDVPWGWQWPQMPSSALPAVGDFDGDHLADRAIVDPVANKWYVLPSSGSGSPIPWGWQWGQMPPTAVPAIGDYDGDHKADLAILTRDSGNWYIIPSGGGQPPEPWGWHWPQIPSTAVPSVGDYDGDHRADLAFVDPAANKWYILPSSGSGSPIPWGWQWAQMPPTALPAVADYDGDGKSDLTITDPVTANWWTIPTSGSPPFPWGWHWGGMPSDARPASGDYDGDGKADRAILVPSTGRWYVLASRPFQIYQ